MCLRLFAKMENLDIHIAVTHLSLAKNDKEWKKVRSENKHLTAEYKETIPYKVKWVGWGDPKQGDPHSERKAFPCQEEGCLKSFPSKVTAARHARWDKKSKQETQTLWNKAKRFAKQQRSSVNIALAPSYYCYCLRAIKAVGEKKRKATAVSC